MNIPLYAYNHTCIHTQAHTPTHTQDQSKFVKVAKDFSIKCDRFIKAEKSNVEMCVPFVCVRV